MPPHQVTMTPEDARAQYNYLLTLCIKREEAFGPLALAFLREPDFDQVGLSPEEQFILYTATAETFVAEPKRYTQKLDCLEKAHQLLAKTRFWKPSVARQFMQDIQRTKAELDIYNQAMKVPRPHDLHDQRLIVETDVPGYFLDLAQRRAAAYYQRKYRMPQEAKTAQQVGAPPKKFEPDNTAIHKEYPGACAPFMSARTNAFHMLLPFDLKISRSQDNQLEAGTRIFYTKPGYSYPLRSVMGKLCGYHDREILDIPLDDPHLIYLSASGVKESEFPIDRSGPIGDTPLEWAYPMAILEHATSLGPFVQVSCNFKIWFDASVLSLLIQGAPDLHDYGLIGGAGLMTRTYASDKTAAYAESFRQPWQEGLSYNFVNLHLQLLPGVQQAVIPFNTPIFTVYPVLNRQHYKFEDRGALDLPS